jgi:hypothetical protein
MVRGVPPVTPALASASSARKSNNALNLSLLPKDQVHWLDLHL